MRWPFGDSKATVAVTSEGVVSRNVPILYVSHETDEDGEIIWQFHHDPNSFDFSTAMLVRLDTMLGIDETISELGSLLVGWQATRRTAGDKWTISEM